MSRRRNVRCAILVHIFAACLLSGSDRPARGDIPYAAQAGYRSPSFLAVSPDGKTVYVTDSTAGALVVLDTVSAARRTEIPLSGDPLGLALSADGRTLYVAEWGGGTVAVIDTAGEEVSGRIPVGRWPTALALSPDDARLYVCNQDTHRVSVVAVGESSDHVIGEIPVVREPCSIAATPDGRYLVVTNLLAHGAATDPALAARVSILDAERMEPVAAVPLPPGSTQVRGVCLSPNGEWAYVVHALGRIHLPITQLDRGWVNTYALSIIDVACGTRLATVLLDDLMQGAADPHSIACSGDGRQLWISHSGVHEISRVDIGLVHELLSGDTPRELAELKDGTGPNIWGRIQQDRSAIRELENDLTALYIAGAIERISSGGKGPRGIALSPDEQRLFVANYYTGSVAVLATSDGQQIGEIPLGPQTGPDAVRRGEMIFHDATLAFGRWHSCATCHANSGRVDGLRWDFLGDGIGNPKDTISLLHFDKTEPMNRRATMQSARECAKNGLQSTNMRVPTEQEVDDLFAYLTSLQPDPSPHLNGDGELTEAARRGKGLFTGKAGCVQCHPKPYFTDRKMHDVGTGSGHYTEPDGRYDTPSLLEAYRTAPYLHDGRAVTIREVLTKHNRDGKHGHLEPLSQQELDDLVAYVKSL